MTLSVFSLLAAAIIAAVLINRPRKAPGEHAIRDYPLPDERLAKALRKSYPHLSDEQIARVILGLREYFQLCRLAQRKMVAMPSQAVDVAWHELILDTRGYQRLCHACFGRFLHHTPAQAMSAPDMAQEGIRRAWQLSCRREGIAPDRPQRLPLLFALDADLAIPDGFHYRLDCQRDDGAGYTFCASHIGCGSGCGGSTDSASETNNLGGDGGADSGCNGGCGGGCGGD